MNIYDYLKSGVLEDYISGSLAEAEVEKLLHLKTIFPEVEAALYRIDVDLIALSQAKRIPPPPGLWERIDSDLNKLAKTGIEQETHTSKRPIEIEDFSKYMWVERLWKWRTIGIMILIGILIGLVIYLYLENQQLKVLLKH